MNAKTLPGTVVGLTVTIILVATFLMPALTDAVESTSTTYTNEGSGHYYEIDPTEEKIVITASNQKNWTLNGETYSVYGLTGVAIITTDVCRVVKTGYFVSVYDETGIRVANVTTQTHLVNMTYDPDAGTFVFTYYEDLTDTTVSATYTYDVSHFILYNPDGDWTSFVSDGETAPSGYYVNDTSQIIAGGVYTTGALDTSYFAQGETVTVGVSDYTASATVTTTDVINEIITGSDYTVTVTDGTTTETFIPYTIYVPKEVVGHTSEQIAMNSLYGVIPIVLIAAIVLASVSFVMTGRRD